MTNLSQVSRAKQQLEADGLTCERDSEDGIPHLSVWNHDQVMTLTEASRIALKAAYFADCQVNFHNMGATGVSLFVYDQSRDYDGRQLTDYGMPVSEWAVGAMELPGVVDAADMQGEPFIDGVAPSQASGFGFLWARRPWFGSTTRSGKWCVTCSAGEVDALWEKVCEAVKLGHVPAAIASTPAQAVSFDGTYLVAVFNDDWTNVEELKRVREMLRSFGVEQEIGYKRDLDTTNGVFGGPKEWLVRD